MAIENRLPVAGPLNMRGQEVVGLPLPTDMNDAVNREYVDMNDIIQLTTTGQNISQNSIVLNTDTGIFYRRTGADVTGITNNTDFTASTWQQVGGSGDATITFGGGAGEVATWAEGNSTERIPLGKENLSHDVIVNRGDNLAFDPAQVMVVQANGVAFADGASAFGNSFGVRFQNMAARDTFVSNGLGAFSGVGLELNGGSTFNEQLGYYGVFVSHDTFTADNNPDNVPDPDTFARVTLDRQVQVGDAYRLYHISFDTRFVHTLKDSNHIVWDTRARGFATGTIVGVSDEVSLTYNVATEAVQVAREHRIVQGDSGARSGAANGSMDTVWDFIIDGTTASQAAARNALIAQVQAGIAADTGYAIGFANPNELVGDNWGVVVSFEGIRNNAQGDSRFGTFTLDREVTFNTGDVIYLIDTTTTNASVSTFSSGDGIELEIANGALYVDSHLPIIDATGDTNVTHNATSLILDGSGVQSITEDDGAVTVMVTSNPSDRLTEGQVDDLEELATHVNFQIKPINLRTNNNELDILLDQVQSQNGDTVSAGEEYAIFTFRTFDRSFDLENLNWQFRAGTENESEHRPTIITHGTIGGINIGRDGNSVRIAMTDLVFDSLTTIPPTRLNNFDNTTGWDDTGANGVRPIIESVQFPAHVELYTGSGVSGDGDNADRYAERSYVDNGQVILDSLNRATGTIDADLIDRAALNNVRRTFSTRNALYAFSSITWHDGDIVLITIGDGGDPEELIFIGPNGGRTTTSASDWGTLGTTRGLGVESADARYSKVSHYANASEFLAAGTAGITTKLGDIVSFAPGAPNVNGMWIRHQVSVGPAAITDINDFYGDFTPFVPLSLTNLASGTINPGTHTGMIVHLTQDWTFGSTTFVEGFYISDGTRWNQIDGGLTEGNADARYYQLTDRRVIHFYHYADIATLITTAGVTYNQGDLVQISTGADSRFYRKVTSGGGLTVNTEVLFTDNFELVGSGGGTAVQAATEASDNVTLDAIDIAGTVYNIRNLAPNVYYADAPSALNTSVFNRGDMALLSDTAHANIRGLWIYTQETSANDINSTQDLYDNFSRVDTLSEPNFYSIPNLSSTNGYRLNQGDMVYYPQGTGVEGVWLKRTAGQVSTVNTIGELRSNFEKLVGIIDRATLPNAATQIDGIIRLTGVDGGNLPGFYISDGISWTRLDSSNLNLTNVYTFTSLTSRNTDNSVQWTQGDVAIVTVSGTTTAYIYTGVDQTSAAQDAASSDFTQLGTPGTTLSQAAADLRYIRSDDNGFGTNANQVAPWARGNNGAGSTTARNDVDLIPDDVLPNTVRASSTGGAFESFTIDIVANGMIPDTPDANTIYFELE